VAVLRAGSAAIERFVADAEASLLVLRRANG
jgi:hypothetical protein